MESAADKRDQSDHHDGFARKSIGVCGDDRAKTNHACMDLLQVSFFDRASAAC